MATIVENDRELFKLMNQYARLAVMGVDDPLLFMGSAHYLRLLIEALMARLYYADHHVMQHSTVRPFEPYNSAVFSENVDPRISGAHSRLRDDSKSPRHGISQLFHCNDVPIANPGNHVPNIASYFQKKYGIYLDVLFALRGRVSLTYATSSEWG